MKSPPTDHPAGAGGFTLVELLVVMLIIALLAGLIAPAFTSLLSSSKLTQVGGQIHDQLALARQEAVTKNREVQAIFMQLKDRSGSIEWRAVQLWSVKETFSGPEAEPLGKIMIFEPPNVISGDSNLSPLLTVDPYVPGSDPVNNPTADDKLSEMLDQAVAKNGYKLEGWARLRMKANGSIGSQFTASKNFITVYSTRDPNNPPANYATIQVNPITGKVTTYRP